MFRARIYAQGFTLLALVAGSIFYKDERVKRKQFESAVEEKKNAEKRDKWIQELEARDREDREWRQKIERQSTEVKGEVNEAVGKVLDQVKAHESQKTRKSAGWFSKKDPES